MPKVSSSIIGLPRTSPSISINTLRKSPKQQAAKSIWGVSKNRGTLFSIINHPFWGTPIFGNTHLECLENPTHFTRPISDVIHVPGLNSGAMNHAHNAFAANAAMMGTSAPEMNSLKTPNPVSLRPVDPL